MSRRVVFKLAAIDPADFLRFRGKLGPLAEVQATLRHAERPDRRGKVLLAMTTALALAACHHSDMSSRPAEQRSLQELFAAHQTTGVGGPGRCATTDAELDKTCSADRDCAVIEQILDECMTTAHLGVSARGRAVFAARPPYNPCGDGRCPLCNVRWQFNEDCSLIDGAAVVSCVAGRCMTHSSKADGD